jgi:capsular exopolysaccharide synthesis family protein
LLTIVLSEGAQWFLLKDASPSFVSTGRMIVNVKVSIPEGNVYSEDVNNFFGTQVALMQSDSVINRVNLHMRSVHPDLSPAPVDISVTIVPKSSIFNLRASGGDPAYTQAYLQATMDEYINLKRDLLENASTATQSSMAGELKQMGLELQKSKEEVLNYQSSNNVVFLQPTGGNNAADYLSSLTRQLAEHKSELQLLKGLSLDENLERQQGIFAEQGHATQPSEPNTSQKQKSSQSPGVALQQNTDSASQLHPVIPPVTNIASQNSIPSSLGDYEMSYLQAKQEIILLKAKREVFIKANLSPKAPEWVDVNQQIAHQEQLLEIYKEESREQLKNRQHILEAQIQNLEGLVKEWELNALDASKKLSAFDALKENEKRVQSRYDQMQANLQRLEVDKGIGQESVTLLEPATPALPVLPETIKHLIMAGLTGLVLGIGILVLIDRLDDRAWSCTELEQLFDMPVLGQFPLMKAKNKKLGPPILQLEDDRYPMIEAYRSLRSALLYGDSVKDRPKSIMITSARPNDGKSMVSANFAVTLAQAGAHVLLIDADLRRGVLHKHFSVAESPGLAEVLAGQSEWSTAVVHTPIPNLDILPCGTSPRQPGNLFATAGKFLAQIPRHYDYYLFDTAPVMVGDDVLSLAPHVDALIMVIRAGFTSGRVARAALDSLNARHVKVVGLVFNAVRSDTSDYYNYKFKEYYPQPLRKEKPVGS